MPDQSAPSYSQATLHLLRAADLAHLPGARRRLDAFLKKHDLWPKNPADRIDPASGASSPGGSVRRT